MLPKRRARARSGGEPVRWIGPLGGWVYVVALVIAFKGLDRPPSLPHDPSVPEPWPIPAIETVIPPRELACLALNIYHEARGEPELGRIAVGQVVLNRAADKGFPKSICAVVQQGGETPLNACQFSWWCDGRSDRPDDETAWAASQRLAEELARGWHGDPTGGALWYHAESVTPVWRHAMDPGPRIGRHRFYRRHKSGWL